MVKFDQVKLTILSCFPYKASATLESYHWWAYLSLTSLDKLLFFSSGKVLSFTYLINETSNFGHKFEF